MVRGLFLFETSLPARYYIPQDDVRIDLLTPTAKTSYCPYKGRASYWSLRVGDVTAGDAAWAYLDPLPECPRIKGHLCFYPEKVERTEVERTAGRDHTGPYRDWLPAAEQLFYGCELVSRFRSSPELAARSEANFGIEGH